MPGVGWCKTSFEGQRPDSTDDGGSHGDPHQIVADDPAVGQLQGPDGRSEHARGPAAQPRRQKVPPEAERRYEDCKGARGETPGPALRGSPSDGEGESGAALDLLRAQHTTD